MKLTLTNAGGTVDITGLATRVRWAGDYRQCARTLDISIVSSPHDSAVPAVGCPVGCGVSMAVDGAVFAGYIMARTRSTQGNTIDLACYDRGFYLKKIEVSRKLNAALPEDVARELCAAFRIPAGELARTGVRVTRNFPASSLWDIIRTAYVLAAQQSRTAYHIGFEGAALCARVKAPDAQTPVLDGSSLLMDATTTESVEGMVNSVVVLDEAGKTVQTLQNVENKRLYGIMQQAIKQGKDSALQAQSLLDDNGMEQKITINCLGDTRLTAGRCVIIREPYTGLDGLFWIETDTHEWKNGVHTAKLTVSFRAMMDEKKAGEEEK